MHQVVVGVWGVGFRGVLPRTLPEPKQKHRFLQCSKAIWRALVGNVEQLLLWIRIEAEQQRERDLTRRSAARRIATRCSPFATLKRASERVQKMVQNASFPESNGHDLTLLRSKLPRGTLVRG